MKSKRALVITLVVSIALNLVALGLFLGNSFGSAFGNWAGPRPEMNRIDPVFGMRRLLGDLPEDRARALAPLYRAYFSAMRPRFREIRGTQDALRGAMLSDPLDAAALRGALESFQAQLTSSQRASQDAFIALAAELTLTERQQLVENLNRRPERWQQGDQKRPPHWKDGPPPVDRPPYHHIPPEPPPQ
jgi:uncharacterized membrane protein